ncbi:MAG: metallopeptidase family protein [Phycisphaeraceae bacterium]
MLSDHRQIFDELFDSVLAELPEHIHALLEEVPVVVEDYPSPALMHELGLDARRSDLCGLHSGIALTHRSVEHSGVLPDRIMLFREPIIRLAGRRRARGRWGKGSVDSGELERQIRITLLHEIGHHFGLDEDDLRELGYA